MLKTDKYTVRAKCRVRVMPNLVLCVACS